MKNPGIIVRHEDGRTGIIYQSSKPLNGKVVVHWGNEKSLVDPMKLKQIGFVD